MKLVVLIIAIVAAAAFLSYAFWPVKFETYYIPANVERGWIVVDFNNPKCPPLEENRFRGGYTKYPELLIYAHLLLPQRNGFARAFILWMRRVD